MEASEYEFESQVDIMDKIAARNSLLPSPPKAYVDTYGCQQNEADSERLRGMLSRMGYVFTQNEFEADVALINTCAVREHAEMRILGNVGALVHAKKARKDMIIAVCGCMVQQEHMAEKIKKSYPHVDLVFGTHELQNFPELLERLLLAPKRRRVFAVSDSEGRISEGLPVHRDRGVKSWLPVMYGCNNFCSYCIVPYVRGRERSRLPENVIAEAREIIASGYKDITLLGQNVNSYGKDLGTGVDFAYLIEEINKIEGEFVIRFMTSHPKDATRRLFETMAACEKAARHIHLPFQAGNTRVLKAMNRGYTKEQYLDLIAMAKEIIPDIVLTSDVIVGFPGETDEEFEDTLDVIRKVRFDSLFTFIYSKRKGTPAAEMPDPFTREEKQKRFDRLLELQNAISSEKHAEYVGKTMQVLVDGEGEGGEYNLTARTSGGRLVHLAGDRALIGSFTDVEITGSTNWALFGKIK
ncbi:MAG TPA: tRNA (N6-isopentenyl adenosine(37)-C2)-methylthiotransferase MiaB [Clostridiales bacterium]|jgi:tRNA-2-methylthio-N6-dimethylallyladenosine synthase|nr:tRNA (N6-isopentenyl adenosine(37)-C2)-methylthiotransferase MiaB [Clostridiales bacterium]